MSRPHWKKHAHSHAREVALQALYQFDLGAHSAEDVVRLRWLSEPPEALDYCRSLILAVVADWEGLNARIRLCSDKDYTQISTVVRCILRMAMHELDASGIPPAVLIDDYVNLARRYEGEEVTAFVHAIVDRHRREHDEVPSPA